MIQEYELKPFYDESGYLSYFDMNRFLETKGFLRMNGKEPILYENGIQHYLDAKKQVEEMARRHYYRKLKGLENEQTEIKVEEVKEISSDELDW